MIRETKIILKTVLEAMEEGQFQEFILELLPLADAQYSGLERFGGTVEGKTRKGKPDLIKTLHDGGQIAVECSTAGDYWKIPSDQKDYVKWKPCKDADECCNELTSLQEIVLCSNREVPTNHPNAKSKITFYVKEQKPNIKVRLICLTDIENYIGVLASNPTAFLNLCKRFLPSIHDLVVKLEESSRQDQLLETYKQNKVPLDVLDGIFNQVYSEVKQDEQRAELITEKINELGSRFEIKSAPFDGIERDFPENFPLIDPAGRILSLIGVPKIGKTSLAFQCAKQWNAKGIVYKFYSAPFDEKEIRTFVDEFLRSVYSTIFTPLIAVELVSGLRGLDGLEPKRNTDSPNFLIIDNVELLPINEVQLICKHLKKIKQFLIQLNNSVIFISNKTLRHECTLIDNEMHAFPWKPAELRAFIDRKIPSFKSRDDQQYFEDLEGLSGGHPLLALALAQNSPTREELIVSVIKKPSITHESLSSEIEEILFNNLLKDDKDLLNLVLRLSVLTHRANLKVINGLCKRVKPEITAGQKLLIEKLLGAVLEGDDTSGYVVTSFYKKIAESKLSQEEKVSFYEVASTVLLAPEGKTLDAMQVIDGIYYSLFAHKIERAFFWAGKILQSTMKSTLTKVQMTYILEKLELLAYIQVSTLDTALIKSMTVMLLAMNFSTIEKRDKALKILAEIKAPQGYKSDDSIISKLFDTIIQMALFQRALLTAEKSLGESITLFNEIDFEKLKHENVPQNILVETVTQCVRIAKAQELPQGFISKLINFSNTNDPAIIEFLMDVTSSLGVKAHKEGMTIVALDEMLTSRKPISKVLIAQAKAEYALQNNDLDATFEYSNEVEALMKQLGISSTQLESKRCAVMADAYYNKKDIPNARTYYLKSINRVTLEDSPFNYGWANYRLGLLEDDPSIASKYFEESSKAFNKAKYDEFYGRSEGERATAWAQQGQYDVFAQIAEFICTEYYVNKKTGFAVACVAIMGQVTRLTHQITGKPMQEIKGLVYPEIIRGIHARMLDIAKPQAGTMAAFFGISSLYEALNKKADESRTLNIALGSFENSIENKYERACVPLIIFRLLDFLIPDGSKDEIKKLLNLGVNFELSDVDALQSNPDRSKAFISHCLFFRIDSLMDKMSLVQKEALVEILSEIERDLFKAVKAGNNDSGWWLAEVSRKKSALGERHWASEIVRKDAWMETYQYGEQHKNLSAVIDSAHYLGFVHAGQMGDLKHVLEFQKITANSLFLQGGEHQPSITLGTNLIGVWRRVSFNNDKIDEPYKKINQYLVNGATALQKLDLSNEIKGMVMLLLLDLTANLNSEVPLQVTKRLKEANFNLNSIPQVISKEIAKYF